MTTQAYNNSPEYKHCHFDHVHSMQHIMLILLKNQLLAHTQYVYV